MGYKLNFIIALKFQEIKMLLSNVQYSLTGNVTSTSGINTKNWKLVQFLLDRAVYP